MVFDTGSEPDAHALERLRTDMIGWLTTVTPAGYLAKYGAWINEYLESAVAMAKVCGVPIRILPVRGRASGS